MSGEVEYYYGVVILGLSIPPAVHCLMNGIRKGWPRARTDLIAMKAAARVDLERTKKILRGKDPSPATIEEVVIDDDHQTQG